MCLVGGKPVDREDAIGVPKFCCGGLWGQHCSQIGDHGTLLKCERQACSSPVPCQNAHALDAILKDRSVLHVFHFKFTSIGSCCED